MMERAIRLASKGRGRVEPNPMVGCVVAKRGRVLGAGWHRRFGGPHAEVEALSRAGAKARGATAYVTLEPCCHVGKTGPCTKALIEAGIARVVVSMRDPFAKVRGKGIRQLRAAGIEVVVGCMEAEARALNGPYLMLRERERPWVIAKWAMSLDGRIATRAGRSQWISGEKSRQFVHRLRGQVDGVVVGIGTVLADDPQLTCRTVRPLRQATRIVLDSRLRIRAGSVLVRSAGDVPVIIATTARAQTAARKRLEKLGCEILVCREKGGVVDVGDLLRKLGRREMTNVLVEGGAGVHGAFFDAGLVDEVVAFVSPKLIGGATAPGPVGGVGKLAVGENVFEPGWSIKKLDDDMCIRGRLAGSE